jgi:hypothetical protein
MDHVLLPAGRTRQGDLGEDRAIVGLVTGWIGAMEQAELHRGILAAISQPAAKPHIAPAINQSPV